MPILPSRHPLPIEVVDVLSHRVVDLLRDWLSGQWERRLCEMIRRDRAESTSW
jgi:hypothetical protein